MASPEQLGFLDRMFKAAQLANHLWPAIAACEAAVETAWGTSQLYLRGSNVFGEKQHEQPIYTTMAMPTREVINGQTVTVQAKFIWFPTAIQAFESRMATLQRLAVVENAAGHLEYPEYAAALAATTGEDFVTLVSKRWSTDPQRAQTVIGIYRAHQDVFAPPVKEGATS